jgi:hypothetical protein
MRVPEMVKNNLEPVSCTCGFIMDLFDERILAVLEE